MQGNVTIKKKKILFSPLSVMISWENSVNHLNMCYQKKKKKEVLMCVPFQHREQTPWRRHILS